VGGYKLAHGLSLALRKQGHIADGHIVCSFSFSMAGTGWAIVWDCLVTPGSCGMELFLTVVCRGQSELIVTDLVLLQHGVAETVFS